MEEYIIIPYVRKKKENFKRSIFLEFLIFLAVAFRLLRISELFVSSEERIMEGMLRDLEKDTARKRIIRYWIQRT